MNPETTYQATRSEARRIATTQALETLSLATETASRLRDLETVKGDLPVCFDDRAPRLAEHLTREVEVLAVAMRNGRIR